MVVVLSTTSIIFYNAIQLSFAKIGSLSTWSLGVTTDPGERQSFVSIFVLNLYNAENRLYVRAFILSIKTHTYRLHSMVGKES